MPRTIKVDLDRKEQWDPCLEEVKLVVRGGGLVVYPTETFYGLGGNALDPVAVKKIFDLKSRPARKPLLLLISHPDELVPLVNDIPALGERLMKEFWPGPLTLVFRASDNVPAALTGGTGSVGVRVPGLEFTRRMIKEAGLPLVGTSANLSDKPVAGDIRQIKGEFGDGVDLYLDVGNTLKGTPSTVVDLTGDRAVIVREGRITREELLEVP